MRLIEIQNSSLSKIKTRDEFIKSIYHECKPYFNEVGTHYHLYRGVQPFPQKFGIKNVRLTDRKPLSHSDQTHKELNDLFVAKFKQPFRNALFATPVYKTAEFHGNYVVEIFPIGQFDYVWSPIMPDLFLDDDVLFDLVNKINKRKSYFEQFKKWWESTPDMPDILLDDKKTLRRKRFSSLTEHQQHLIREFIINHFYLDTHLKSNNTSEVMIRCKQYYYFNTDNKFS